MIITCSDANFLVIAKDEVYKYLVDIASVLGSMDTDYVGVIAPCVVGTGYPDLEIEVARRFLRPSIETPWWAETNSELSLMLRNDPLTNELKCRPGVSAWVGTMPYTEAAKIWAFNLANTTFSGKPLIIHRTNATVGEVSEIVDPLLCDVVLP